MKKYSLISTIILAFVVILSSCQKEEQYHIEDSDKPLDKAFYNPEGMTILGKQLENPYSVENMTKALEELKAGNELKSTSTEGIEIETTHLYVRFLPKNEQELDLLKQDTTLDIYDYPLDHEILTGGVSYHDPSLPDTVITWQYTVVSPDYQFPEIEREILAEMFILEEDEDSITMKSASMDYFDWLKLENKALEITGNLDKESNTTITLKASKWRPAGTIMVYDDIIGGNIPVVGALVRARRWFTTHKGYTDNNGDFSCDERFRRDANYSIKWERNYWDIRSGTSGQALYNGPKQRGDWNLNITGGKSLHYATIHRAAYRHFYGNNLEMNRPYGSANNRWKICYYDKSGTGDFWGNTGSPGGVLPDIRIYGNSESSKLVSRVFRTTAHELGHTAHCANMGNVQYWQVSKIIYESWADAVEWALTNQEYEELGTNYTTGVLHEYAHQYWPYENSGSSIIKDKKEYFSLFIDLVDDYNQSIRNANSRTYPNDNVTGYSMKTLSQSIISKSYGLSSLKSNLKANKPAGITDTQIDELFERYEEIW